MAIIFTGTQMKSAIADRKLSWTGERMIPFESDVVTEFFHWQRYLFFRPWYVDARIIDAASGEGYGSGYASTFAKQVIGIDVSQEAVNHADRKYTQCDFRVDDVCKVDYSQADLVLSFETIEHLPDPIAFLKALADCKGRVVISTPNRENHSPGNKLSDSPINEYHTVEWTPYEFAALISENFPGRQVRFLSQENRFPGLIREGLDEAAKYTIAVIGDGELPLWPRIGLSMPTCEGPSRVQDAIFNFARFYPGELEVAVVANGSTEGTLSALRILRDSWPHIVHLLPQPKNIGYGRGANLGLEFLQSRNCDLLGVSNDDVIPSIDCVSTLVCALSGLKAQGLNPGCVGPVSNSINGIQQVDIGQFSNYREMMELALKRHQGRHSELTQSIQVRGLFFLVTPDCLEQIGGFDPVFGLGNFEDDDWNLRVRHAGFSLWVAEGAFLYHAGSSTFKELGLDYSKNIDRNLKLFLEKWQVGSHGEAFQAKTAPDKAVSRIPLCSRLQPSGHSMVFGNEGVDLVWQATETEFAAAVMLMMKELPRSARLEVLELLRPSTSSRCAA